MTKVSHLCFRMGSGHWRSRSGRSMDPLSMHVSAYVTQRGGEAAKTCLFCAHTDVSVVLSLRFAQPRDPVSLRGLCLPPHSF